MNQSTPPQDWDPSLVDDIVARHKGTEGPLLPILHDLQAALGFISEDAMRLVAQALNVTRAEVYGVVSFYHDFRTAPQARHVLKICRAEACQAMGGEAQAEALLARLGLGWGEATADGRLAVEPVYCLGLCACGPNAMLDGARRARLSEAGLDALLREALA